MTRLMNLPFGSRRSHTGTVPVATKKVLGRIVVPDYYLDDKR